MKQKNLRSYIRKYSAKLYREKQKITKTLKKRRSMLRKSYKLKLLYEVV